MYKTPEFEVYELEAEDVLSASTDPGDIWPDEDGKGDNATEDDEL